MPTKYTLEASPSIITNDLYMAAFLHAAGCRLERIARNPRRRVSFVFAGERVRELREEYRGDFVRLSMRAFRDSLLYIRRGMDAANPEQRSTYAERPEAACLMPQPQL